MQQLSEYMYKFKVNLKYKKNDGTHNRNNHNYVYRIARNFRGTYISWIGL